MRKFTFKVEWLKEIILIGSHCFAKGLKIFMQTFMNVLSTRRGTGTRNTLQRHRLCAKPLQLPRALIHIWRTIFSDASHGLHARRLLLIIFPRTVPLHYNHGTGEGRINIYFSTIGFYCRNDGWEMAWIFWQPINHSIPCWMGANRKIGGTVARSCSY